MYTLYIFDESRSVTAIPQAGILGSYLGFAFGLYQPQAYTPLPSSHLLEFTVLTGSEYLRDL
jgi:hypothetical protein